MNLFMRFRNAGKVMLLFLDKAIESFRTAGKLTSPKMLREAIIQGAVLRLRPKMQSHGGQNKYKAFHGVSFAKSNETVGKQTKVTLRALFPTVGAYQTTVKFYGAIEGGKQTLARLADYLPRIRMEGIK